MKRLLVIIGLLIFSETLYADEGLQKLGGAVGFSDPVFGAVPENTPLEKIGYASALGFPVNNRELGIELPSVETVNRLTLELEVNRPVSQLSQFGLNKDIVLYASQDNVEFYRVNPCKVELTPFARDGTDWIRVEMSGFSERVKYLKLCPQKEITGYAGLIRAGRVQHSLYVYKSNQLLSVECPRFLSDRLTVHAELNIDNHANTPAVMCYLKMNDEWQLAAKKPVTENGIVSLEIEGALHPGLAAGKHFIKLDLVDQNGVVISSADSSFYHIKELVSQAPAAGETAILAPKNTGILHGKWTNQTAETAYGQPIEYVKAEDLSCSYSMELPGTGTYAVYIGLIGGDSVAKVEMSEEEKTVRLKTWRKKALSTDMSGEIFVGFLTGGSALKIHPAGEALRLSHVRLQGLTDYQNKLLDSKPAIVPRLIFHSDGFSGFYQGRMKNRDELIAMTEQYKNRPLYSYDWSIGNSTAFNIKTRRGVLYGEGKTNFWRQGDKQASEIVNGLYKQGVNPLQLIVQELNSANIPVNATLRMNALYSGEPADTHNGPFADNPQLRIITPQNQRLWRFSYAHPEVRDFMMSILEDAVACGVDGIHLQFLRNPPFFGVDEPLIAEYRRLYGNFDPKKDYMNQKWQGLQCEMMTEFVKSVRVMLDSQGLKNGRRLALSVSFDFLNYYSQGLDVAAWVKSGWVDVISPGYYGSGGRTFDLKPFIEMRKGTSCKVFPNLEQTLVGVDPTPESEKGQVVILRESISEDYGRKLFLEFYHQGADGLYPFNGGDCLIEATSNMKDLRIWEEFEAPVIDWFNEIKK